MFKKILFNTCLTEHCNHIFTYALNLARQHHAKLWIYHGIGQLDGNDEDVLEAIKDAEGRLAAAYVDRMRDQSFADYAINVSAGDVVGGISKLAYNASIDVMIMGTSTQTPIAVGESAPVTPLGKIVSETILRSPCPVLVVPPTLIAGLARA